MFPPFLCLNSMNSGGSKVAVKVGQKLPSKSSTIKNSRRREFFSLPVGHRESPRVKTEELFRRLIGRLVASINHAD